MWSLLHRPSPGAPIPPSARFLPAVKFLADGGTFIDPFPLEFYTTSSNATIRYTLDGSAPTESAAVYSGPFSISNTVQVRARAFVPGLLPGPLHSESFVLLIPTSSTSVRTCR